MRAAILNRNYIGAHANVYRRARALVPQAAPPLNPTAVDFANTRHTHQPRWVLCAGAPCMYAVRG
jgi:hypothetical protein